MERKLADGEGSAHDPGADHEVDNVGEDRSGQEEPHVHLRIPEYPSERHRVAPRCQKSMAQATRIRRQWTHLGMSASNASTCSVRDSVM